MVSLEFKSHDREASLFHLTSSWVHKHTPERSYRSSWDEAKGVFAGIQHVHIHKGCLHWILLSSPSPERGFVCQPTSPFPVKTAGVTFPFNYFLLLYTWKPVNTTSEPKTSWSWHQYASYSETGLLFKQGKHYSPWTLWPSPHSVHTLTSSIAVMQSEHANNNSKHSPLRHKSGR